MLIIKVGWVPVNHDDYSVAWHRFTTTPPPGWQRLLPPGWYWHRQVIERGVSPWPGPYHDR